MFRFVLITFKMGTKFIDYIVIEFIFMLVL